MSPPLHGAICAPSLGGGWGGVGVVALGFSSTHPASHTSSVVVFLCFLFYFSLYSYDGTSDLATVESYDPVTNSWQPEVSMGTRRSCLGVAALHGLLYAAGGYDGASCLNR